MSGCCHCYGCQMGDPQEHVILVGTTLQYNSNEKQCEENCLKNCHCYGCQMGDPQEHYILQNQ